MGFPGTGCALQDLRVAVRYCYDNCCKTRQVLCVLRSGTACPRAVQWGKVLSSQGRGCSEIPKWAQAAGGRSGSTSSGVTARGSCMGAVNVEFLFLLMVPVRSHMMWRGQSFFFGLLWKTTLKWGNGLNAVFSSDSRLLCACTRQLKSNRKL